MSAELNLITVKCNCGHSEMTVFDTGLAIDLEIAKAEASLECPTCNATLDQKLMIAIDRAYEYAVDTLEHTPEYPPVRQLRSRARYRSRRS